MCFLPGRPRFSSQSIVFRTVRSRKWITIKKAYNHINQIDGPHLIQRPTGVKKRKWFYNWKRWRFIIGAQLLAWLISLQAQNAMTKNASLWIVQSLITFFPKKIRTFFLKWCRKFSQPTSIFNVINSYPWSFPFCQFVYNGNPFCLVFRFSANEMVLFMKIAWTIACQFAICCLPLADIRSKRHYQSHALMKYTSFLLPILFLLKTIDQMWLVFQCFCAPPKHFRTLWILMNLILKWTENGECKQKNVERKKVAFISHTSRISPYHR